MNGNRYIENYAFEFPKFITKGRFFRPFKSELFETSYLNRNVGEDEIYALMMGTNKSILKFIINHIISNSEKKPYYLNLTEKSPPRMLFTDCISEFYNFKNLVILGGYGISDIIWPRIDIDSFPKNPHIQLIETIENTDIYLDFISMPVNGSNRTFTLFNNRYVDIDKPKLKFYKDSFSVYINMKYEEIQSKTVHILDTIFSDEYKHYLMSKRNKTIDEVIN